jgi:integrase
MSSDSNNDAKLSGWPLVDRQLQNARDLLLAARHSEQFQAVGHQCREVLISLANAVYVRERHLREGVESDAGPKQKLEAYVAFELGGDTHKEERKHAQLLIGVAHSALDMANKVQHDRNADHRRALMCVHATENVVDVIAITSGLRDSQHTVADLINKYVEERKVGTTHRYSLGLIARSAIGKKVASKLKPEDVIDHCHWRRDNNAAPATVAQDLIFLRGVLSAARETWKLDVAVDAIDRAKPLLEKAQVLGKSSPRTGRPSREDLARLVVFFTERQTVKGRKRNEIPMHVLMEFALWSARRISEICNLRWADVDEVRRTCIVRGIRQTQYKAGRDHEFPLLGKAWDIIQRQPRVDERIFPYNAHSASASYSNAIKALGIKNLRFNDLRLEAARRLLEAGYTFDEVAKVTGHLHLDPLYRELRGKQIELRGGAITPP